MSKKPLFVFILGGLLVGFSVLLIVQACRSAEEHYILMQQHYFYSMALFTFFSLIGLSLLICGIFPHATGSGIPQVLVALSRNSSTEMTPYLSMQSLIGKLLLIPTFLIGGSLGYEGPAVQIGAIIMFNIGQLFKINEKFTKSMIIAGSGAGLAAAFSAPLTGIVFIFEELGKNFLAKISFEILSCIIVSGLVCEYVLGHYIYLGSILNPILIHQLDSINYIAIAICGLTGGLLGSIFSYILIIGSKYFAQFSKKTFFYSICCCAFTVTLINFFTNGNFAGSGQHDVQLVFANAPLNTLFIPLKIITLICTYLIKLPVGLFTPSLCIGANLGDLIASIFPHFNEGFIILLSMTAFLTGVTQAPLTSFTIVMEASGQDSLLPALMATSLLSHLVAQKIMKIPLYELLKRNLNQIALTKRGLMQKGAVRGENG